MLFGLAPTDAVIIALAVLTLSVVAVSAGRKLDSDLRIAAVRHPDFAKKVRSIVVEFGSTSEQYP
jgi:hypothetical protein